MITEKSKFKFTNMISSMLLVFIFILVDTLSYSKGIFFDSDSDQLMQNACTILYIYPTIISIILYNIFTKIDGGIVSSTIVENFIFFKKITENVKKHTSTLDSYISNSVMIFVVSNLFFAGLSLLIKYLRFGNYLELIPKSIVYGIFATIGVIQIPIGLNELMPNNYDKSHILMYIFCFSAIIIIFSLQKKYTSYFFILPFSLCILILLFYICLFVYHGELPLDTYRKSNWLHEKNNQKINLIAFLRKISLKNMQKSILVDNISLIGQVIFFSLLHIFYNLPSYYNDTHIKIDYNNEIAAQGYTNLFTFLPTYFISCYSVPLYRCGGTDRIYGLLSAFPLFIVAIYGNIIFSYIPRFVICIPPFLIGFTMIFDTLILIFKQAGFFDGLIIFFIFVIAYFKENYFIGIFIGIIIHFLVFQIVTFKIKKPEKINFITKCDNISELRIDFPICFLTIKKYKNIYQIAYKKNNLLIINLTACKIIDWIGSDLLYETVINNDNDVFILGCPFNLNKKRFKLKNVIFVKNVAKLEKQLIVIGS